MKKNLFILYILFFSQGTLCAQQKLTNLLHPATRDTNIIIKKFGKNGLAPFMIKAKNPFNLKDNRVGFIDTTGQVVIQPLYSNCSYFVGDYAFVCDTSKELRQGLIDRFGKIVIPPVYNWLSQCENGLFMIANRQGIGFITITGDTIVPLGKYSNYASPILFEFREGDDVGYMDFRWGNLPFYEYVHFGKYLGVKSGDKWAVIDSTGKEVIPPTFDGIGIFDRNYAIMRIDKKYGLIDASGKTIVPALYDKIKLAPNNDVYVTLNGKAGVISLSNKIIIPFKYNYVSPFGDAYTALASDNKAVLYSAGGERVSEPTYNPTVRFPVWGNAEIGFFMYNSNDKKFHAYQNIVKKEYDSDFTQTGFYMRKNKWGLIDNSGKELTSPLFDSFNFEELAYLNHPHELISVKRKDKWGIINGSGKIVLPVKYDGLLANEGRLFVKKEKKYAVFNNRLQQLTPIKYDTVLIAHPSEIYNATARSLTFIRARIINKWGLIDSSGTEIIPFNYDRLLWIYHNFCLIENNSKYGLIDIKGKQIADCLYDAIFISNDARSKVPRYNGQFTVKKNDLFGLIDSTGRKIADPVYEDITQLHSPYNGRYKVKYQGKVGLLDEFTAKMIIPCVYDDIVFFPYESNAFPWELQSITMPYIIARKNGLYGLIDTVGNTRLPFVYQVIRPEGRNYYFISMGYDQAGLLDRDLKTIIPPKYSYISPKGKDLFIVHSQGGVGLIGSSGKVIAEAIYQAIVNFCGDKIILKKDNKLGAINTDGKIIEPFIYSQILCKNGQLIKTQ
ncbi:MAG: repeat-containing protein [Mucilaginibacter sp.]|nr:repeat-containing protein [Mucilaginibacter sp.]